MAVDGTHRRAVLLAGAAAGVAAALPSVAAVPARPVRRVTAALAGRGSRFVVGCDDGAIASLRYRGDRFDTDYVRAGAALGRVHVRYRTDGGAGWRDLTTGTGVASHPRADTTTTEVRDESLLLASTLSLREDTLVWTIDVANHGAATVEIGDLMLPLPMHTRFEGGRPATEAVLKHSFVSGHGSHVFWMRSNSAGPYLLMLPDRDTHLEYWDVRDIDGEPTWCAYVHAAAAAGETAASGTRWRQPVGALALEPGEVGRYVFRFLWVADYAAARSAIAAAGGIDVEVVPGMTVPCDLAADLALASADPIERIEVEYPDATTIEPLPPRAGRQLWRVRFSRLGENRLTLHQAHGRRTHLEFFATEPVETMMKKRAAFIVRRQHRNPALWYDGLFGEWNMATGTLLGPDNYDRIGGWRIYEVTCDDPGLSKPAYLASKNAEHPVQAEVAALEHYIDRFVWGGLQQTTREAFPYAIYGIPDWKQNRASADPGPKGRRHVWRPYDYPHIFTMYLAMYRIARDHPGIATRLSARDYLLRAHGTAIAMFTVPMRIAGWSAYETGFYNECVIPDLVVALRAEGLAREAAALDMHWARKVRRFCEPARDLFGSEYPFDSTGFESTQAFARSALDRPGEMGVTPAAARAFADRQLAANLFCRGWLEPAYYYLGSDYRAQAGDSFTLTYMAQMGGWALLDHALNDAADPWPLLRLGYASQLSTWALLNGGSAADGHGYWYPGEANDGAAAGGFEPAPAGMTWLDQPHHRGAWYYSCEADLGFCGALRAARTILADDPVFGRICLGGTWHVDGDGVTVVPADGVRRRLSARLAQGGFDLELTDARFVAGQPVAIRHDSRQIVFAADPFDAKARSVTARFRVTGGGWRRVIAVPSDGRFRLDL